jgi:glycosyltransferase involved in cell wall biosynthesis
MNKEPLELSFVVPLFNEEGVVQELYERLTAVARSLGKSYEIIFVDDGSTDSTLQKATTLTKLSSTLKVVELARNFGQTAALAAGVDHAQGRVIITMDGDLQHQPEEVPRFLEMLDKGYDVVSGWRKQRTDNPLLRRFPSYVANRLANYLCGVPLQDFGSTYKAYRADLVKKLQLFGDLHRFVPILAARVGARITEIPITVVERKMGTSNYGLSRTFGVSQDILFLVFYSKYLTRPIRAFGLLFLVFFGSGFMTALALMLLWTFGIIPAVREHGALLLFSVFLMIVGVQFLVAGVLAELLSRIYLQTKGDKIYAVRSIHERANDGHVSEDVSVGR